MPRWHVQVVQLRARDIRRGDVIAKDATRTDGWFRVSEVKHLPDGSFNLIDKGNERSFTAAPFDLVGLQTPVPLPAEADRSAPSPGPPAEKGRAMGSATPGPDPTAPTAVPGGSAAQTPEGVAREMASRAGQDERRARELPSP